jgi:alpha-amylase
VQLSSSEPAGIWTFPVETVSQSEGGFELVHQSVVVIPHWRVRPDAQGRWSVTLHLEVDTHLAESRMETARKTACV